MRKQVYGVAWAWQEACCEESLEGQEFQPWGAPEREGISDFGRRVSTEAGVTKAWGSMGSPPAQGSRCAH